MKGVIHHCGAGTTAAGLRSGTPSVILTFFGCQPLWGRRVHELGVEARPIHQEDLSPKNPVLAIFQAVSDPYIGENAAKIGIRIQSEDGVESAVKQIQRYQPAGFRNETYDEKRFPGPHRCPRGGLQREQKESDP
jgi:sterol 3beta-glucosyltransferase